MAGAAFAGSNFSSWADIPMLQILDVSFNRFEGQLPSTWVEGFQDLKVLRLDGNQLTGLPDGTWHSRDDIYLLNVGCTSCNAIYGACQIVQ